MQSFFRKVIILCVIFFSLAPVFAQKIIFTYPDSVTSSARSDQAVALINDKEQILCFWKEPGPDAALNLLMLDSLQERIKIRGEAKIPDARSSYRPTAISASEGVYLFWINQAGNISYILHQSGADWNDIKPQEIVLPEKVWKGLTIASGPEGQICLGTLAAAKKVMLILVLESEGPGKFTLSKSFKVPRARSENCPYLIFKDSELLVAWSRLGMISYMSYNVQENDWSSPENWEMTNAGGTPAVFQPANHVNTAIWIWPKEKNLKEMQYTLTGTGTTELRVTDLPEYYAPAGPVALCAIDREDLLMVYPGYDGKLMFSIASVYNPSKWMEEEFFPHKQHYTLKDIVLPGSHDAGMSQLTARGGKSGYTINECNTLTQTIPVAQQLASGIRMFDLRVDLYQDSLYTKHAPSDCMDDAVGGGWGESLGQVLRSVRSFLDSNQREIVILSFAHFCERHLSIDQQAGYIADILGKEKIFTTNGKNLNESTLAELSGKVLLTFEGHNLPEFGVIANTMEDESAAFFNYKRMYAATGRLDSLLAREKRFFNHLRPKANDYIRLDWQLTQPGQQAAISCSQFQSDKSNAFLDGALLVTNLITKSKSIVELAGMANKFLPGTINDWIDKGIIGKSNKPNIIYVDVADNWITDYCIDLNRQALYSSKDSSD